MPFPESTPVDPAGVRWRWFSPGGRDRAAQEGAVLLLWYQGREGEGVPPAYWVKPMRVGLSTVGWTLERLTGTGTEIYDIDGWLRSCPCLDYRTRGRRCKHLVGLTAALTGPAVDEPTNRINNVR